MIQHKPAGKRLQPASAFVIYSSVSFYYFDTSIILPLFADLHRRWFGSDGIYVSSNLVTSRTRQPSSGRPRDNNLLWATSIPGLTFLIYPVTGCSGRSSHTMSSVYFALSRLPFRLFTYANMSVAHSGPQWLYLWFHNTSCLS
jgi:hypothetical protein